MPESAIDTLAPVAGLDVTLGRRRAVGDHRPPRQPELADHCRCSTGIADAMEQRRDRSRGQGGPPRRRGSRLLLRRGHQRRRHVRQRRVAPDDIVLEINRPIRAITALPHPVVAVVQGPAAGVGVSLALACDVVLASDKAFFMLAFTKIGLMPDGGASALVAAAIGRIRAMRMALLAERLPAAEALSGGLVSAVYPADDFEAEVDKVIAQAGGGPRGGVRQDQARDQRGHADRVGSGPGARIRRTGRPAAITRLQRGHNGVPAAPHSQLHRPLNTLRSRAYFR